MDNISNGLMQYRFVIIGKEKQEKIIDTTARVIPEREANIVNDTPTAPMLPVTKLPFRSQSNHVSPYVCCYGQHNQTTFNYQPALPQMHKALQGFVRDLQLSSQPTRKSRVRTKVSFSPAFHAALGVANTEDCLGVEEHVLEAIFAGLVEQEAERQRYDNEYLAYIHELAGHSHSLGWIEMMQRVLNISYLQAVATLGNIVGMDIKNLVQLTSRPHAVEMNARDRVRVDVPDSIELRCEIDDNSVVSLDRLVPIRGHAGQTIGAIAMYRCGQRYFCLPATVGRGVLCIGKYAPTAHFLNQGLIDKTPDALVIFCQDPRVAITLDAMVRDSKVIKEGTVIVTTHLGSDLSVLPWSYFRRHRVYFCPAPSVEAMSRIPEYETYLRGQGVTFRVFPRILLWQPREPESDTSSLSDFEREIVEQAIELPDVELPSALVQKIEKEAISVDKFVTGGQEGGIFTRPKQDLSAKEEEASGDVELRPFICGSIDDKNKTVVSSIFSRNCLVLLYGHKDVGKSMVVLAAISALIQDKKWLCHIPSGAYTAKVLLIDSETPQPILNKRLQQFGFGYCDHLLVYSKLVNCDSEFTITSKSFQEKIDRIIDEKGITHVIFDNLTSLIGGNTYSAPSMSNLFEGWISALQKRVGVIIVHHADDGNSSTGVPNERGSREISIRSHTVLYTAQPSISKSPEIVQKAAKMSGCTVGVHFKTCKMAPELTSLTFWAHLPLNSGEWQYLCATRGFEEEVSSPFGTETADKAGAAQTEAVPLADDPRLSSLSADAHTVYTELLNRKTLQTSDAMEITGFGDTKAREILNELKEAGLAQQQGKGRGTRYVLAGPTSEETM